MDARKEQGVRLENERIKTGLTRKQMAEAIGIQYQRYYTYENGSRLMPANILDRMKSRLGVDVEYIITGARVPKKTDSTSELIHTLLTRQNTLEAKFRELEELVKSYTNSTPKK